MGTIVQNIPNWRVQEFATEIFPIDHSLPQPFDKRINTIDTLNAPVKGSALTACSISSK